MGLYPYGHQAAVPNFSEFVYVSTCDAKSGGKEEKRATDEVIQDF